MTYRDDRDAAHARADALARELEEERRRREQAEATSAARERENAALQDALERHDETSRAGRADADRAARELEALARGAEPKPVEVPPPASPADRTSGPARRRRLARSADGLAAIGLADAPWVVVLYFPLMFVLVFVPARLALAIALGAPVALVVAVALARATGPARIRRWAASRPYRLHGLVPALEAPPPSRRVNKKWQSVPADDGHDTLSVVLRFDGATPAVLDGALRAFDPEIKAGATAPLATGIQLTRPSPHIYRHLGKHDPTIVDHNHAVLRWLRRLDREVLGPLHRAHALREVTVRLSRGW